MENQSSFKQFSSTIASYDTDVQASKQTKIYHIRKPYQEAHKLTTRIWSNCYITDLRGGQYETPKPVFLDA